MEASSLSPNNRRGLSLLATDFDEEVFQELLVLAFAILTRQSGASEEHLTSSPKFSSCDKVALKHAYAGLTTLLLEAAVLVLEAVGHRQPSLLPLHKLVRHDVAHTGYDAQELRRARAERREGEGERREKDERCIVIAAAA